MLRPQVQRSTFIIAGDKEVILRPITQELSKGNHRSVTFDQILRWDPQRNEFILTEAVATIEMKHGEQTQQIKKIEYHGPDIEVLLTKVRSYIREHIFGWRRQKHVKGQT